MSQIVDLPPEIYKFIDSNLTLLDSYHFHSSNKSLYNKYEYPTISDISLNSLYISERNKHPSIKDIEIKTNNIRHNLKFQTPIILNVANNHDNKYIFEHPEFNTISLPNIDTVIKPRLPRDYSYDGYKYDNFSKNLSNLLRLKIYQTHWNIKSSLNINGNQIQSTSKLLNNFKDSEPKRNKLSLQLIPADHDLQKRGNVLGTNKYHQLMASLPQQTGTIDRPLNEMNWEEATIEETISPSYNLDLTVLNLNTTDTFDDFKHHSETLSLIRGISLFDGKYLILIPDISKHGISFKKEFKICCYKLNKFNKNPNFKTNDQNTLKSDFKLIWESTIKSNIFENLISCGDYFEFSSKLQISNEIFIIPIKIIKSNDSNKKTISFYYSVFNTNNGKYLGNYEIQNDLITDEIQNDLKNYDSNISSKDKESPTNKSEFFWINNKDSCKVYIHGSNVFLTSSIKKRRFFNSLRPDSTCDTQIKRRKLEESENINNRYNNESKVNKQLMIGTMMLTIPLEVFICQLTTNEELNITVKQFNNIEVDNTIFPEYVDLINRSYYSINKNALSSKAKSWELLFLIHNHYENENDYSDIFVDAYFWNNKIGLKIGIPEPDIYVNWNYPYLALYDMETGKCKCWGFDNLDIDEEEDDDDMGEEYFLVDDLLNIAVIKNKNLMYV